MLHVYGPLPRVFASRAGSALLRGRWLRCAPLPGVSLYRSFTARSPREIFTYDVNGQSIRVTREPGPDKVLNPAPRTLGEFEAEIVACNQWTPHSFLTRLSLFSYVEGVPTSLSNGTLKRYLRDRREERRLTGDEIMYWVEHKYGIDPQVYRQAEEVHRKWMEHFGLEVK